MSAELIGLTLGILIDGVTCGELIGLELLTGIPTVLGADVISIGDGLVIGGTWGKFNPGGGVTFDIKGSIIGLNMGYWGAKNGGIIGGGGIVIGKGIILGIGIGILGTTLPLDVILSNTKSLNSSHISGSPNTRTRILHPCSSFITSRTLLYTLTHFSHSTPHSICQY